MKKISSIILASVFAVGFSLPAMAQVNTNTTIQDGAVNTNTSQQSGRDNDNATVQRGRDNLNTSRQRGDINTNQTGQSGGGVNENRSSQRGR